jgi:carotenoid cleavage dioxygenase
VNNDRTEYVPANSVAARRGDRGDELGTNEPLHRRDLLRLGAGALSAIPLASLLAACGDGGASKTASSASRATTTTRPFVEPFDRSKPWWLQGDFAPVQREVEAFDLEVRGAIPRSLDGLYVRNGSNAASGKTGHWFLGDGMVHGVRLERGRAKWYRNRWIRTELYTSGASIGQGNAAAPGGAAGYSNVSVFTHAGRLLSSGEVGYPYLLSADDLSTVGVFDFAGKLTTSMTAHPKVDPVTKQLHFFGYGFTPPFLTYHVADEHGALVHSEPIDVKASTMIHDFAITDRDVVFWELPVVFDMQMAVDSIQKGTILFPFRWDPSYGARLGVMPLGGPATEMRWVEIDPCYVFHGVNAFRDGDDVVVDVCRHPSMFAKGVTSLEGEGTLHRWRIGTGQPQLTVKHETLEGDAQIELPTHDLRRTGREHRYGWFVESRHNDDTVDFAGVVARDFRTGKLSRWDPGAGRHGGEALFVPDPDAGDAEGEGWVCAYVYDARRDASVLAILDATDVGRGPVAEITLPQRVPYGFHATWV